MVNLKRINDGREGLRANDKVEGKSEEGRAVFAELCSRLTKGQLGKMAAHRVLNGDRRVTRDLMEQAMTLAGVTENEKQEYWQRYFGGPPVTTVEFVRRRMIIAGGRKEYAEQTDLNPHVISTVLKERLLTHGALRTLMVREPFPWTEEGLIDQWKKEHEEYLQECYGLNQLGARVETLFAMHPNATRTQWVDLNNPPASLKEFSANERRKMMSAIRHGRIETWERADRVLVGLGCDLKERIHVAKAWLTVKRQRDKQESVPKDAFEEFDDLIDDDEEKKGRTSSKPEPCAQSEEEYPEEFREKTDTEIIAELLRRYTETSKAPPAQEEMLSASIDAALADTKPSTITKAERSARNAELAMPMVALRIHIASRWERIAVLLQDLEFSQKLNLTEKILSGEAPSERIRQEIQRILGQNFPGRAKVGELITLLAECDEDAVSIQQQRNTLAAESGGLVGSFFQEGKFSSYYADVLDYPTRKAAADRGLLRACDTFNPATGELSTFAFVCIKSQIRREAEEAKKERKTSLDREFSSDADGGSLLAVLEDRGIERPLAAVIRSEVIGQLHEILSDMPVQWRRSVELMSGLDRQHIDISADEAADIMNQEGLRTMEKGREITGEKVRQWAKQGKHFIAKNMVGYERMKGDIVE